MTKLISMFPRRLASLAAVGLLIAAMGGTWTRSAAAAPPPAAAVTKPAAAAGRPGDEPDEPPAKKSGHKQLTGRLNLNTANEDQLQLLPTVGPAKAERIVAWRAKN